MNRVLVMTSRVPWPLEKGDKLRMYHQLRAMRGKVHVALCCLSYKPVSEADRQALLEVCDELHIIRLNRILMGLNLLRALFSDRPYQVHYFFQRRARKRVYAIASAYEPDHIYCQLIRAAEYVKHIHVCPKTLDYMDALGKGMERRASSARGLPKRFINAERKRLGNYENLVFDYFEHHTIISEQDRGFILHPQNKDIQVVPNGVDTDYFKPAPHTKDVDVLFLGNMNYPPNVDGASYLVEELLPLLREQRPDIRIMLAGANPHRRVKALEQPGVTVTGWMDDVREAYLRSKVFVAPMRLGTGLQNKLLEALSMELPCTTTSLAFRPLAPGAAAVVTEANTSEAIAYAVLEQISAAEADPRTGATGRTFVQEHYSWAGRVAPLLEQFHPPA